MAEIVNLRRARKAKARADAGKEADANRTRHGVAKSVRSVEEKRREKTARNLEAKRLDKDE
jgi:hypothetical protein